MADQTDRTTTGEGDATDGPPSLLESTDLAADEDVSVVDDYLRSVVARDDVAFHDEVLEFDDRDEFEATRERARRLRGNVVVVVADEGELLLVENDWMDGYGIPGGGVEPDEDWERAAVREVAEETGVDVALDRPLAVYGGVDEYGDERFRGPYTMKFLARPVGDRTVADDPGIADEEIQSVDWFGSPPDRMNDPEALGATFDRFAGTDC